MNYIKISKCDIANGPGVRVVLWLSGCSHHCYNCHNPDTWDPATGSLFSNDSKQELFQYLALPYIQGITLSGGDPLFIANRQDVLELLREIRIRFPQKDVWIYTGYTWEQAVTSPLGLDIVQLADVIVDGRFVQDLYSISLLWRGSSNQRVIDVKKTLRANKIVSFLDKEM